MRFSGLVLLASATLVGACGGGDNKPKDTANAPAATAAPPAAPAPAAGAVAKIPATGKTVEMKMIGDDKGYRFEPADITIKTGDAVKFVMVAGGPHNVSFDPSDPAIAASKAQLDANMDSKVGELMGPNLMNPNEEYIVSFGGVKPGKYEVHCTPHLAMNMKGTITVQ
jgi:plastocyanin